MSRKRVDRSRAGGFPISWLLFALAPAIAVGCSQKAGDATGTEKQKSQQARPESRQPSLPAGAVMHETSHYLIYSSATDERTNKVAVAVESLHAAYASVFRARAVPGDKKKLILVLYKDRAEFKRNNRSSPWAEAYYLSPRSHAYFDASGPNPYHWMIHEATHQLEREVSGFKRVKWVDEGLASYFGASRISAGKLNLGEIDADAYPIWWLGRCRLSGSLERDIANGQIIPLRNIIEGRGGPDINRSFNQYYIHYWSLTHFLFHYRNGTYAKAYKRLIADGASLENFERIIGPVDRIQEEWYGYLSRIVDEARKEEALSPREQAENFIQIE